MKRIFYVVLAVVPLAALASKPERRPIPPIDVEPPAKTETAIFALG